MCEWHGGTWKGTKVLEIAGRKYNIDSCIYDFVKKLNDSGLTTVASCCGHNQRPSRITLESGMEIFIAKDFETAKKIDDLFPPLKTQEDPNERR